MNEVKKRTTCSHPHSLHSALTSQNKIEIVLECPFIDSGPKPRPPSADIAGEMGETEEPLHLLLTQTQLRQRPQGD